MSENKWSTGNWLAVLAAIFIGVPLLVVGVVAVKTWLPLREAGEALNQLDHTLGQQANYRPARSGEIPADRMELFLELRASLVAACGDYANVQKGFDSVESLESKDPKDPKEVGSVALGLGGAALPITPFLARFFELRNEALLAASMGLQEWVYIYAVAYHDLLLAESTLNEIFSDGEPLSPEASETLKACLALQLEETRQSGDLASRQVALEAELKKMEEDPTRLIWQDSLPAAVRTSLLPYRERLDRVFCAATAGLEMERSARRALAVALE